MKKEIKITNGKSFRDVYGNYRRAILGGPLAEPIDLDQEVRIILNFEDGEVTELAFRSGQAECYFEHTAPNHFLESMQELRKDDFLNTCYGISVGTGEIEKDFSKIREIYRFPKIGPDFGYSLFNLGMLYRACSLATM